MQWVRRSQIRHYCEQQIDEYQYYVIIIVIYIVYDIFDIFCKSTLRDVCQEGYQATVSVSWARERIYQWQTYVCEAILVHSIKKPSLVSSRHVCMRIPSIFVYKYICFYIAKVMMCQGG